MNLPHDLQSCEPELNPLMVRSGKSSKWTDNHKSNLCSKQFLFNLNHLFYSNFLTFLFYFSPCKISRFLARFSRNFPTSCGWVKGRKYSIRKETNKTKSYSADQTRVNMYIAHYFNPIRACWRFKFSISRAEAKTSEDSSCKKTFQFFLRDCFG